jgi:alpha-1,6-mannosyltransferase
MWAGFVAYLGGVAAAPTLGRRVGWGAIALLLVAFAAVPPLLSHDVHSYVDYARLGALHGLDPYVHPPSSVPADPAFADVDWTEANSAYGPLFTLATYPLARLPVEAAVYVLKAVAAASVLGLAMLVARIAPARGVDPLRAAAFVALNPLVLVHVAGGAHNDGLAILLATLGAAAVLASCEAAGAGALVAALGVKATAAFVAPFALIGAERRKRFLLGALGGVVLLVTAAWLAFGWSWLEALGVAGENQGRTSHMSIPITVSRLADLDPNQVRVTALVLYAVLVAYLLAWTWRGGDWLRAAAWAGLGLLLATAWLLPWYLIWSLPLAALSRDRALKLLLLGLTAYQLGARIPL